LLRRIKRQATKNDRLSHFNTAHTFFFFIAALAGFASGQVRQSLMEEVGKDNLPSQQLGVDDLVAVSVYDAPELTRTVRVEADGTIHLPLLHDGIKASGLLSHDLEDSIANELTTEQILVNPVVKVTVVEYHSRPVAVMGAVKLPLTFQAVGVVTLLDALAKAGGLTELAGSEILVSRGVSLGLGANNTTEQDRPKIMRCKFRWSWRCCAQSTASPCPRAGRGRTTWMCSCWPQAASIRS
jgi:hypothetical protein